MIPGGPIKARAVDGMVVATIDSSTARVLAEAFAAAHLSDRGRREDRPRWHEDVTTLIAAAAEADAQAGTGPAPVMVPFFKPTTPARLVVGDPT